MDLLRRAFDPEVFRLEGRHTIDHLATYLERALSGEDMPILPWAPPEERVRAWDGEYPEVPVEGFQELLGRILRESTHLHHPRFAGHQVCAPLPIGALSDLVGALLNNGMAIYEMGPAATAIETRVVRWLCDRLGYGPGAGGVFTHGGSLGNLTALLALRQQRAGFDAWENGASGGPALAVLASTETHYCVDRAVRILGWGAGGIQPVPVDERFRMRADSLPESLARARAAGRRVVGVVASAGSTATGSYDPLPEIADFSAREGLWLHVDGAHGASAAVSHKYRSLVEGIDRADSVVWDAHKLLLSPALATAVLYRDGRSAYEAFAQDPAYLFEKPEGGAPEEWYNTGTRTLECTKRMAALALHATLRVWGTRVLDESVTAVYDLARRFAARIAEAPDFELAVEPESNIVCYRYLGGPRGAGAPGADPTALDSLQARIRRRIVESGAFYIVQARLPRGLFLRSALMNPFTTDTDLADLLEAIRGVAAKP